MVMVKSSVITDQKTDLGMHVQLIVRSILLCEANVEMGL